MLFVSFVLAYAFSFQSHRAIQWFCHSNSYIPAAKSIDRWYSHCLYFHNSIRSIIIYFIWFDWNRSNWPNYMNSPQNKFGLIIINVTETGGRRKYLIKLQYFVNSLITVVYGIARSKFALACNSFIIARLLELNNYRYMSLTVDKLSCFC